MEQHVQGLGQQVLDRRVLAGGDDAELPGDLWREVTANVLGVVRITSCYVTLSQNIGKLGVVESQNHDRRRQGYDLQVAKWQPKTLEVDQVNGLGVYAAHDAQVVARLHRVVLPVGGL